MERIKQVIRKNLPETNSSSSHSVVICVDPSSLTDTLPIDSEGIIHVPERYNAFGWEYEKYNDPMTKLQYVCGIVWKYKSNRKKVKLLKEIVLGYTGAKDLVFDWEENKPDNDVEFEEEEEDYFWNSGAPDIDHNSSDIFPEIMESAKSIKNFIFNSGSWLYLGNDNSDAPEGFYEEETSDPEIIVSVDYGGDIGRVDFEYNNLVGCDIKRELKREDLITEIVYNTTQKKFEKFFSPGRWNGNMTKNPDQLTFRPISTGDKKLYWISEELEKKILEKTVEGNEEKRAKSTLAYSVSDLEVEIFKELISDTQKWGSHWICLPYTVITKEFGKVL